MNEASPRFPGRLVAMLCVLPVLYVLSYGPYICLADGGWLGPLDGLVVQLLWWFYSPVALLTSLVPGLREVLSWYVSFWIGN